MNEFLVYDVDGILWFREYAKEAPKVGFVFRRNSRLLKVLEVYGNMVTVMEVEN